MINRKLDCWPLIVPSAVNFQAAQYNMSSLIVIWIMPLFENSKQSISFSHKEVSVMIVEISIICAKISPAAPVITKLTYFSSQVADDVIVDHCTAVCVLMMLTKPALLYPQKNMTCISGPYYVH